MNVYGHEIPNLFVKVCSELQYANDIVNGRIFMNESSYFRKLDDTFRGDFSDGRRPVDAKGARLVFEGELGKIDLTDTIERIHYGFPGDNKIPIFSCSVQDESIFDPPQELQDGSICLSIKESFIEHISQFGTHAVIFSADEFITKVTEYVKKNTINAKYGKIKYCDLLSKYDIFDLVGEDDMYLPFFRKDMSYAVQNEWRLILISAGEELISADQNHFVMDIGKLEYAGVLGVKGLCMTFSESKN